MGWLSSILGILKSFFSFLDKKTLTEEERVAKEERGRKQRVKNDRVRKSKD